MIGLDTVRFAVPVAGWRTVRPPEAWDRRDRLWLAGGARAEFESTSANGSAYVEASLPNIKFNHNLVPLPVAEMKAVVLSIVANLDEYVVTTADQGLADLKVLRLDIDRDFHGVAHTALLLRSLGAVARPRRVHSHLHSHGDRPETLTVGTKNWSITAYDKHTQTRGRADPGHLRCEVRLRTKRLRQTWARENGGMVNVLADVTEDKMLTLSRATFTEMGFGLAAASPHTILHLIRSAGLKPQEQAALLYQLICDAQGLATGANATTERKYRRLAHTLGAQLADDAPPNTVRLDWETGTEVEGA